MEKTQIFETSLMGDLNLQTDIPGAGKETKSKEYISEWNIPECPDEKKVTKSFVYIES
jgi:hypothetical protein